MKIAVDGKKCIGCGLCVSLAEKSFKLVGCKSVPLNPPKDEIEVIEEAAESCPVSAIKIIK